MITSLTISFWPPVQLVCLYICEIRNCWSGLVLHTCHIWYKTPMVSRLHAMQCTCLKEEQHNWWTILQVGSIESAVIARINCPLTIGPALMYTSVCSATLFCTRALGTQYMYVGTSACEYIQELVQSGVRSLQGSIAQLWCTKVSAVQHCLVQWGSQIGAGACEYIWKRNKVRFGILRPVDCTFSMPKFS